MMKKFKFWEEKYPAIKPNKEKVVTLFRSPFQMCSWSEKIYRENLGRWGV
jgi:hypothetical protein